MSWLDEALAAGQPFAFGEIRVTPVHRGFVLRGPAGAAVPSTTLSVDELRSAIQTDDRGRYRPLSGALSLPSGWAIETGEDPRDILEVIYPLATKHIEQYEVGALRVVPLEAVLDRQSGRYERASTLSAVGQAIAKNVLCGSCARVPAWAGEDPAKEIPCPEPCSVMVSLCREAAGWEADRPEVADCDPTAGFADFESPGNEIRVAWMRERFLDTGDE